MGYGNFGRTEKEMGTNKRGLKEERGDRRDEGEKNLVRPRRE